MTITPVGGAFRGAWRTDTDYNPSDIVTVSGAQYTVSAAHTSGRTPDMTKLVGAGIDLKTDQTVRGTKSFDRVRPKTGPYVDVTHPDFGADPTGVTDSSAAFKAAMAFAVAQGIETVYIPEGTYTVTPGAGTGIARTCMPLIVGLKCIQGAGRNLTKIKVASGVGDYYAVFHNNGAAQCGGLTIRDLTIDQNTTGNVITDASVSSPLMTTYPRFCVSVQGLAQSQGRVTLRNVRFIDMDNVNAVTWSGNDVVIHRCHFAVSAAVTQDHDHSAIYTNVSFTGGSAIITCNVLESPASNTPGARTAIETHGGAQYVEKNTVRYYQKGANITGVSLRVGDGIHVTNNGFLWVRFGVQLWSRTYSTNLGPLGIKNVHITENTIRLDPAGWTPGAVATDVRGVFIDKDSTLPFADVYIERNTIFTASGHTGNAGDSNCAGIDWQRTSAPTAGNDRNVVIRGNIIDSPLAMGIRVINPAGDWIDGLFIDHNIIRNVGQGSVAAGGGLANGYANGIHIGGQIRNSRIDDNSIVDDQGSPTTNDGLYLVHANTGSQNNQAVNNRVFVANNKRVETSPTISGGWLVRQDVTAWVTPPGLYTVGSEFRDLTTGIAYRQTTAPEGSTWQPYTPGLVLPRRTTLSGSWIAITNRPYVVPATTTGTLAKDSWRYIPLPLNEQLDIDALAVITTTAASGGTAALIFGVFGPGADQRPSARVMDLSTYGSIDLTQTAGTLQLPTVGLTVPASADQRWLGTAWTGTATVSPIITTVGGIHPAVANANPAVAASAYLQALSGASVPASATPSTTATAAPLLFGKNR